MNDNKYPSGYKSDNPGGEWLKNKIEDSNYYAKKNLSNFHTKNLHGATTATAGVHKDMKLPVEHLSKLKGVNNEKRVPGDYQYDELNKAVKEHGFQDKYPVMIMVNHHGEAFMHEGNTRTAIAKAHGIKAISAEVHYRNGAENVQGKWHPTKVAEMEKEANNLKENIEMADLTEKDIGKPGKNFSKIAAKASKEYGSAEAGKRVAGAILAKLRAKHPRKYSAKVAKEEVEEIAEVSKGLLNNYIKKAKDSSDQAKDDADKLDKEGNYSAANDQEDKAFKRDSGIKRAKKKLDGTAKINATEEVEGIDEISTELASNYLEKASDNVNARANHIAQQLNRGKKLSGGLLKMQIKNQKRGKNMVLAYNKATKNSKAKVFTKEEVEDIDEISKDLAYNYAIKASGKTAKMYDKVVKDLDSGKTLDQVAGDMKKAEKRDNNIDLATRKIIKKAKVNATEEVEPVNELSKGKLWKYMVKVEKSPDKNDQNRQVGMKIAASKRYGASKIPATSEEVENIDEISKKTALRYVVSSNKDNNSRDSDIQKARSTGNYPDNYKSMVSKSEKRKKFTDIAKSKAYGVKHKVKVLASEEAEEVDELSKDLVTRYNNVARKDEAMRSAHIAKAEAKGEYRKGLEHMKDKNRKRRKSIALSTSKIYGTGKAKVLAKEETLDEISKKSALHYVMNANRDNNTRNSNIQKARSTGNYPDNYKSMVSKSEKRKKFTDIAKSKAYGVKHKIKVIASEETEEIDELSSKTLGRYVNKAAKDVDTTAFDHGGNFYTKDASVDAEARADHIASEKRLSNRRKGINKATNKLVKRATANEEIEGIEESKTFKDRKNYLDGKKSDNFRRALKKNSALRSLARKKRNVDDRLLAAEEASDK